MNLDLQVYVHDKLHLQIRYRLHPEWWNAYCKKINSWDLIQKKISCWKSSNKSKSFHKRVLWQCQHHQTHHSNMSSSKGAAWYLSEGCLANSRISAWILRREDDLLILVQCSRWCYVLIDWWGRIILYLRLLMKSFLLVYSDKAENRSLGNLLNKGDEVVLWLLHLLEGQLR